MISTFQFSAGGVCAAFFMSRRMGGLVAAGSFFTASSADPFIRETR